MVQDDSSFWADIKKYEDTLDRDPNSYCFAPLSELYRKVGMVDDAITVAKRGCDLHPDYVGGYMALGRAFFEKGMYSDCRSALEKVVRVTPDNLLAQRLLSQIYIDAGEVAAAEEALNAILAQNPGDTESRILLDSLTRRAGAGVPEEEVVAEEAGGAFAAGGGEGENEFFDFDEGEEIIDLMEAEIVEELTDELVEEEEQFYPEETASALPVADAGEGGRKDPLTTVTLAELYVSQGFPERAATIYRELLALDPENGELKERLAALTAGNTPEVSLGPEEPQTAGRAEDIIQTLENWLGNIKRRRLNGA